MILLMVSETIAWPRDMYVWHVSGIRQYSVLHAAAPATAAPESTPAIASAVDGGFAAVDEILVKLFSETMTPQTSSGGAIMIACMK